MLNDYLSSIQTLISDITNNVTELSYIDPNQVAVNFKRSRENVEEETWAEITGLDAETTGAVQRREGRTERHFASKSLLLNGNPVKYIIDFYVPAFLKLSFKEKLSTVFHELYHIAPKFDGNLRLFKGKSYKHGPSMERYDKYMEYLVDKYLVKFEDSEVLNFLKNNTDELFTKTKEFVIPKLPKPEPLLYRVTWS